MVRASILIIMESFIKVLTFLSKGCGRMINKMEMEFKYGPMDKNTKDILTKV